MTLIKFLDKHKRKERNFPIQIDWHKQAILDEKVGMIEQFIVTANNYVIAHFVDVVSKDSYMNYLKQFGFTHFPEKVIDIIEQQYRDGVSHKK